MLVNSKRDPSIEECHFESLHTIFSLSLIQFLNNKGYGYEALFFFYNYWILDYNKNKAFRERRHPSAPRSVNE